MGILQVESVSKRYKGETVLDNVSFEVEEGDFFGIVGMHHSGKSTLANLMLSHTFPKSGHIKIFDQDVAKKAKAVKKEIGFAQQLPRFYPSMSAYDILEETMYFHDAVDYNYLDELIGLFRFESDVAFSDLRYDELKVISFLNAVIAKPKLIILDEPTQKLDIENKKRMMDVLHKRQEEGATILVFSRDLQEVEMHCNKLLLLNEGKVVSIENLEKEKKQAKYITTFHHHFKPDQLNDPNVYLYDQKGNHSVFVYTGDYGAISSFLAPFGLKDVSIENLNLDQRFAIEDPANAYINRETDESYQESLFEDGISDTQQLELDHFEAKHGDDAVQETRVLPQDSIFATEAASDLVRHEVAREHAEESPSAEDTNVAAELVKNEVGRDRSAVSDEGTVSTASGVAISEEEGKVSADETVRYRNPVDAQSTKYAMEHTRVIDAGQQQSLHDANTDQNGENTIKEGDNYDL